MTRFHEVNFLRVRLVNTDLRGMSQVGAVASVSGGVSFSARAQAGARSRVHKILLYGQ